MRCRQGDLAIVVMTGSAFTKHLGKLVRCLRPYNGPFSKGRRPGWVTDYYYESLSGVRFCEIEDACLRPIRDNDGTDEMLRIAGKPTETPADVIREVADATGN